MVNINLIVFTLCFIFTFLHNVKSKDYDSKSFTCADEIGPLLKFKIPDLEFNKPKQFNFKTFNKTARESFTVRDGIIKKVSSPIDNTYYFYLANTTSKKKDIYEIIFEFYPPSHLLIKYLNSQYSDLVCWND